MLWLITKNRRNEKKQRNKKFLHKLRWVTGVIFSNKFVYFQSDNELLRVKKYL